MSDETTNDDTEETGDDAEGHMPRAEPRDDDPTNRPDDDTDGHALKARG